MSVTLTSKKIIINKYFNLYQFVMHKMLLITNKRTGQNLGWETHQYSYQWFICKYEQNLFQIYSLINLVTISLARFMIIDFVAINY
jgi:hypothetical protein